MRAPSWNQGSGYLLLLTLWVAGCQADRALIDSGVEADAGSPDAGGADAGRADAGGDAGSLPQGLELMANVRSALPETEWEYISNNFAQVGTLFNPHRRLVDGGWLSHENRWAAWVQARNPNIKAVVYGSGMNCANFGLECRSSSGPCCTRRLPDGGAAPPVGYESWYLKDVSGGWVDDWEFPGALVPDPGNRDWQNYVAAQYRSYISDAGYEGVFVDLVDLTTHYVNFTKDAGHWAIDPRTDAGWTDPRWRAAMLELLRVLRSQIGDKLMIVNGADDYERNAYWDVFDAGADMAMNEQFAGAALRPPWQASRYLANWRADVRAVADCARRGKTLLAVPNVHPPQDGGHWSADPAYQELYRFLTASYLLGSGEHPVLFYKAKSAPGEVTQFEHVLPDVARVRPGRPLGDYSATDAGIYSTYRRAFTHALVFVNPSGRDATATFEGTWRNEGGALVSSPLPLPAGTGLILTSPE